MDERLKFVARLLDGEKMAVVCREFGISRKTGYKIFNRYKDCGLEGLTDQSRRPYHHANQLPFQVERAILRMKKDRPSWGAPKIREKLIRTYPMITPPAKSTVHAVLDRHGLVKRRKARRYRAKGTPLQDTKRANGLWCADYKGEFRLGNRKYCYPLTRIKPGHPQQNGRHERMHLTLKKEATKPPGFNFLQQQSRFDDFQDQYNHDRPHQALNMKYPGEVYTPSTRVYEGLAELDYPFHDKTIRVTGCGRICIGRRKINLSTVFAGQTVGIREVNDKIWLNYETPAERFSQCVASTG